MDPELLAKAKSFGFSDRQIACLTGQTEDAVRAERQRLGLDENTFAIHKTLGETGNGFDTKQAKRINALFEQFSDYRWNKQQESKLRTELYKTLRPLVGTEKMIEMANRLLRLQRV